MAKTTEGLEAEFRKRIDALIAASGGKVYLVSGYRSPERQAQLWAAAVKKYGSAAAARKWVAPPGKSNHGRGIAVDLGGDLALAAKLAAQHGLARPMRHEPWHFEPSGARAKSDPEAYTTPPDDPRHTHYGTPVEEDNTHDPVAVGNAFVQAMGSLSVANRYEQGAQR